MIVTVGNTKGGVGKTTLAVNLAVFLATQGDTLLIDGDEQGTAAEFSQIRFQEKKKSDFTVVRLYGAEIRTQVLQMRSKYSDIVIDVGGRDTGSLRAALTISDVILIPIQPRSFDLWALDKMVSLLEESKIINEKIQAYIVINQADFAGKDNHEAFTLLKEDYAQLKLIEKPIVRRKAFANAVSNGLSVFEFLPKDTKAIDEMAFLIKTIFGDTKDIKGIYNEYPS